MVRDCPTLMRHLWNEFFSVGGLMLMFRIRILLCFVAGLMYVFSPLDIIPEGVFGVLGLLDDIFVMFLLAMYISIIYRRLVVSRRMATWYRVSFFEMWHVCDTSLSSVCMHYLYIFWYSRTPLMRTLVIRTASYRLRLRGLAKFVDNSTKPTCLEITGYRTKCGTALLLLKLRVGRGRKV